MISEEQLIGAMQIQADEKRRIIKQLADRIKDPLVDDIMAASMTFDERLQYLSLLAIVPWRDK